MTVSGSPTVCVGLPDLPQHLDGERQGVLVALEGEPLVHPGLAEVAVHDVALQDGDNGGQLGPSVHYGKPGRHYPHVL